MRQRTITDAAGALRRVALLTGVQARLAAILLTGVIASFTLLVHGPMLLAALIGAAWAWQTRWRNRGVSR